ncbi:hypothetical protein AAFF_G00416500 [Aldrovandia affinis]|uniref:Uncharacterized protein n=1 Tax=Aldrovandia affinis TaxID=143900 RepID=A0AAD7WJD8_9TELE|nr:hypothetical protein AAFF_G00416500 [Aldrovandia affinis]
MAVSSRLKVSQRGRALSGPADRRQGVNGCLECSLTAAPIRTAREVRGDERWRATQGPLPRPRQDLNEPIKTRALNLGPS